MLGFEVSWRKFKEISVQQGGEGGEGKEGTSWASNLNYHSG